MKRTSLYLSLIVSLLILGACGQTPESESVMKEDTGPTVEGVWTVEEREVIGGPDEGTFVPQAGILIFTKKYYSSIRDMSANPRPLIETDSPSDAQLGASLRDFGADSGPYELTESTITFRPTVCNDPNMMSGGSVTFDYELTKDTFTLINKPGRQVIPEREQNSEFTEARWKLKRLE